MRNAETNTEDSDGEKSAATGETQPVVVIDIHGYIVDGGTEAIHALQSKLTSLKKQGFYFLGNSEIEGGFVLVRTENKNVINLPEIYSPLPKLVKDDDFGETDELNRSEHLTWKADSENIQSFRARLLYEPQKTVLPQGKFKEMLKNAEDSLKNAKSVSATAGTKQQISSAEGNAEEKNASPAAADKPSDVAKSENAEPKASSAVTEKAVAADKDKAAASVPEKEKTDSEAK